MTQEANAIKCDNPSFSLNLEFTSRLNRSVAAPLWALTRIGGRRHCLKTWETRGDAFFLTMWNGNQHEIPKNSCEARWEADPRTGVRTVVIKLPNQNKSLWISEQQFLLFWSVDRDDFSALIEELNAKKGKLTEIGEMIKTLGGLLKLIK